MPCIQARTSVKTSRQTAEEIKEALKQTISCLPGESEDWLMVSTEDECQMFFGGKSSRPITMIEVRILGNAVDQEGTKRATGEMIRVLGGALEVSPDNMYIKYEASPDWGWNETSF